MARPKGSRNVVDLDAAIGSIAQKIKDRASALKQEIESRQEQLGELAEKYERLTGTGLGIAGVSGRRGGGGGGGNVGPNGKRLRRLGVDVEWISSHLSKEPMTLKQLQAVAEREGRSSLSVMNVLRTNKNKFKSAEGDKEPGVRGRAAQVWSAK